MVLNGHGEGRRSIVHCVVSSWAIQDPSCAAAAAAAAGDEMTE